MPSFFDERILTTLQALADSNDNLITLINQFVDITQVRNIPSSQLPGHYTLQEEMNLNGQVQSLRFKSFSREDYVCLNKFSKHSRNPNSQLWSHYIVMGEIEIHNTRKDRYLITNLEAFSVMLPSPSSMTTVTLIDMDVFIWQIWNSSRRQRCWWCLEAFITNSKIWCVPTKPNLGEEDDTDSDIVREIPLVSLTTKDIAPVAVVKWSSNNSKSWNAVYNNHLEAPSASRNWWF